MPARLGRTQHLHHSNQHRGYLCLVLDLDDLSKHDGGVSIEESDTGETLARLEVVDNQRLGRLEHDLGHLVGLESVRGLHLLSSGLLTDLPVDADDLAGRPSATDESDRGVTRLGLSRNVQGLDLGREVLHRLEGGVRLQDHDISGTGEVVLVKTLDVHSDVVTRSSLLGTLVVHLDGEDLSNARVGGSVGRHEDDLITGVDNSLLDTSGKDITDSLDLVGSRDGQTKRGIGLPLRHLNECVQGVEEGVDVNLLTLRADDIDSAPPSHVGGLGDEVVSHPSRDGQDRHRGLDKVRLPANLAEHVAHLVTDLLITGLLVAGDVRVHLVDTHDELLDSEEVDQTGVLAGLSLDLSGLVVTLLDGGGEVSVGRNHQEAHIGLGGTGNHVLNEIPVSRGIDDGVVPPLGVELLGRAGDGDTTSTLLLLAIHVESEGERRLSEGGRLLLQLLNLTLRDTPELEDQASGGRGLSTIDVSADHDRQMGLVLGHGY
mmetsp:Transcript_12824/g.36793  ORF Transcript_12824/g.36793 Transcript_12824/m.36793 type:complete len:488 (+) Transcript_12824:124-1587(+)